VTFFGSGKSSSEGDDILASFQTKPIEPESKGTKIPGSTIQPCAKYGVLIVTVHDAESKGQLDELVELKIRDIETNTDFDYLLSPQQDCYVSGSETGSAFYQLAAIAPDIYAVFAPVDGWEVDQKIPRVIVAAGCYKRLELRYRKLVHTVLAIPKIITHFNLYNRLWGPRKHGMVCRRR
jgi:hypothetical protein